MEAQNKTRFFASAIIFVGFLCVLWAAITVDYSALGINFVVLAAFTIAFGSRITVQIPSLKSHVAVSDTFIFVALLEFGGEAAVLLAATEAFFSSWRFCNKKITVFFNAAVMACSATAVILALRLFSFFPVKSVHTESWHNLIILLSLTALTYFIVNSSFTAFYGSLKSEQPFWETWKTSYLWTSLTYFIGAVSAGVLDELIHQIGFVVLIATVPIILIVYSSYRMYLRNVEISVLQAEQANEYAAVLESQAVALSESEERFRSAFKYAPIGIALVSLQGEWLKVNNALREILGYTEEEFLATDFQSLVYPGDLGSVLVNFHLLVSGKTPTSQLEHRYLNQAGQIVWVHWSVSTTTNNDLANQIFIFQIQDITNRKEAETTLQYKATHDPLTSLPNRAMFMVRLDAALEKRKTSSDYRVSVLFIDLDRFKIVNDSLGHHVGDALLIEISTRLLECLRPADLVARLGGDEFTILIEGTFADAEVLNIADRINKKFALPFHLDSHEVYSSASIGILHATEKHNKPEDLMRDADIAMYQAKRGGKSRYEVFNQSMHEEVKQVHELGNDLRRAIEKNDIEVHYQPIVCLESRKVVGFEALARWDHPTYGQIGPDRFIPLAEESGLIGLLGMNVLKHACNQGHLWNETRNSFNELAISVNLSCKQFSNRNLVEHILGVLKTTNLSPHLLKLEITESVFLEHKDRAISMLNELCARGIQISIDDFGTGYSNLSCLTQMPISTLKIDRSFIKELGEKDANLQIAEIVVKLATTLNLDVVAEGIETETQLNQLKTMGCEKGQGYLFGKAMTAENATQYLNTLQNDFHKPHLNTHIDVISSVQ
jgi:diguanylate cyclase (GGDEF)-like protein/PAS domain S-box-containing protein